MTSTPAPHLPLLHVHQWGRKVGDQWLWRNVEFALYPGDRLGLSGPSGMGKTLFLRSLVGLDSPEEGHLEWQGHPLTPAAIPHYRSVVGLLLQRAPLWEGTVAYNLQRAFRLQGQRGKEYNPQRAQALLDQVGRSADFLERSSQHLSGGERQLVALLRVLLCAPQVLLLDEPTAALDGETALQVEALIQHWYQEKPDRAYLWVSHDRAQLQRLEVTPWALTSGN